MPNTWNDSILNLLCIYTVFFVICCLGRHCVLSYEVQSGSGGGGGPYNSFLVSSFSYSKIVLKPYDWRYIRVDLPPWFSAMSIALESYVDPGPGSVHKDSTSTLAIICLREGSPPLPDVYNTSSPGLYLGPFYNISAESVHGLQNAELCSPMQKNMSLRLTNEQISPGIWYLGLFNGIGPMRTRSKMINRGPSYSFSGNVSVEGCTTSMLWGQFCNVTVQPLSCVDSYNLTANPIQQIQTSENVVSCRSTDESSCLGDREPKVYSLDVTGIAEQLTIMATNVKVNGTVSSNENGVILTGYARHGSIPQASLHDYSGNISQVPLVIRSPKVGRWYITVLPFNMSNEFGDRKVCYSLDWQVLQCPVDKAGLNCTWERYMLQTVLRKDPSALFESYYIPVGGKVSSDSANFLLEPLLSNSSSGGKLDFAWTYFLLEIPSGAAGGNIHVQLNSDTRINYEIYAKQGGLSSLDSWDYFYANSTSNSNGSAFFKLYDSNEQKCSFYILYVSGGTWSFGLKHLTPSDTSLQNQTTMSLSLERCPRRCSPHGKCQHGVDASGLAFYSYCSCDRDHGGFDCGVEIVSRRGHIWQSISLIASNAAAVLPAYWALRQKAFAEWVLYTCSGISSGLYHSCDVGTWCPLSFHVLQFMDFWLSFMAVVSTFVYLAAIDEGSKRTIHTVLAILTALMAETGPTRSTNIVLVIAIGASALLIAWLIEFCTKFRSLSFSMEFSLDILHRWQTTKAWLHGLVKTLLKRFRWGFVLGGFIALAMAAISWKLETTDSYWIWHSVWHVSIYTSSFLFLCSKANIVSSSENQRPPPDENYELTRQDSFPRVQQSDTHR